MASAMELNWLEDYLELCRTGNFSRAAEARHLTQPAFSRRIRALEDWAGVTLFDRSAQPVALTAAGREFQPLVAMLLRRIGDARAHVREVAGVELATIRVAATHALSLMFVPDWLRRLEAGGLHCCVHLASDTLDAVETLLRNGQAHFLLCHAFEQLVPDLPEEEFLSAVVADDRLLPCAAPALAAQWPSAAELIQAAPLLVYSRSSGLGRILRAVLGPRLPRLISTPAMTADLAGSLRAICLDGRGLAWLPATMVADDLAAGRLVTCDAEDWAVPVQVRLFRPNTRLSPKAETLWALVDRSRG
jgi:LysR family transcriptional regulator, hypochlorite-specific transcription factor HypT